MNLIKGSYYVIKNTKMEMSFFGKLENVNEYKGYPVLTFGLFGHKLILDGSAADFHEIKIELFVDTLDRKK